MKKIGKSRVLVGVAILSVAIASVVLTSVVPGCTPNPQSATVVEIAANLPMTGELGMYGTAIQQGAVLALEDLEKNNPPGPKLQFDWGDNTGDTQTTVTLMQRQTLQKPAFYTSALKPQTLAITDRITQLGIPHFTWILDMKINPESSNNLRVWVNFDLEASVFLSYIAPKKPRRVAIMYVKTPAVEEEYAKVIGPTLKNDVGSEVMIERLEWNTSDFNTIAAKINAFKPEMLILNGFVPQLPNQIRALRPYGLIGDGNTLASLDMLDAAPILGADELEGIVVAAPVFLTQPDLPRISDWKARFKTRFKVDPSYHSAYAYDMVLAIHDAAKRVKLPASSEEWIQAVRATRIEGVTGQIVFNDDGSLVTKLEPAVYRGGRLVPLKD